MPHVVTGNFEVNLVPSASQTEGLSLMSIDKRYRGGLEGTGKGQMLAGGVEANGARAYVALETVTGELDGREGSFVLAHRGTMTPKAQDLSIIVVPDSGTGALVGLSGEMMIEIKDGQHFYELTYEL